MSLNRIANGAYSGGTLQDSTPAVREISTRSFMRRFTPPERVLIRASTDDIVVDIHEDLRFARSVDLDLTDVSQGLAYLVTQSIIASNRPAIILRDGTADEV